jgi:hypothetical protein
MLNKQVKIGVTGVVRVGLLIAPFLLFACARFPKQHSDPAKNNPATYKLDMADCADAYPETPDGVYLKRRISCMNLKGWQ